MGTEERAREMVDWDLAVATGARLVGPGPPVTRAEAERVVADLRTHARTAQGHVRDVTGLHAPGSDGGVAVIDRARWVEANAAGFRTVLEPVIARLRDKHGNRDGLGSDAARAVGARVTALQTGALLAFLSTKVLGQYELFPPFGAGTDVPPGRLLLVAPNIVAAERDMGVDPRDFRLWVCVHEETHRVQFGAVSWLRGHVLAEVALLLEHTDFEPADLLRRLRSAAEAVTGALREGGAETSTAGSLVEALQTPAQREVLDRLTAVMSLLEGHADHVMDAVGPEVIPSVADIRRRFQQRREGAGRGDRALRRLLGIEAKMRQYRDGARFVSHVVDTVGMDGFNRVWRSAADLPTLAEITDPAAWVARVHPEPVSA